MNQEDLVGIVSYWLLQGEATEDVMRRQECAWHVGETLGKIAMIEIHLGLDEW